MKDPMREPLLSPLRGAVKVNRGRGDKLIRAYGAAAIRAARRGARVVSAMHADDPMFYCHGKVTAAPRKRMVKRG